MTINKDITSLNFEFLKPEVTQLAQLGGLAETLLYVDPGSALIRLRSFAEEVVKLIYMRERLPRMPQASFYDLLKSQVFEDCVDPSLINHIHFLRLRGNDSAHGGQGSLHDAQKGIGIAHQVAIYFGIKYLGKKKQDIDQFKDIKDPSAQVNALQKSLSTYEKQLETQQEELDAVIKELEKERAQYAAELPQPSEPERKQRKRKSQEVAASLQWNEEKTRLLLIDSLLLQAGWDVSDESRVGQEIEVDFPANPSGKGYVDYVLWDDNGQPLAVVEAKRSGNESLQAGREQARLYADAFERMGKQRPIIFYTNGYETFIWDDVQYNTYRRIYGIYSKDSLQYLIYQRQYRQPHLERFNPDMSITERPYQIEGIKTVAAHFQNQRRKALIIQATGTGKTRVSIALAELLSRTGWAKRILFLCDRKELRTQADDAFKEHLGSEPRCVIGEKTKIDQDARVYIATYPGMMNRFAQLDVGFFDLIIADESHRSIYNKYRDLFDYFDALQVGLTATPVKFISRNTFEMFDCENMDPTFEFDLEAAINHEPPYLVPFRVRDLTTNFLRDGIHYNDLTDQQKRQLEEDLGLEEAQNTTIAGRDIGRKIFSESTDTIILENLMDNGIKDETGSLVGKTIIFAQRQDHAEHLERLFCKLYPQHGAKVCKVIHNRIPHVESLIKDFKKPDNQFRIAISVDMLDTGIDVPEVVNLVFAKPVKSWVKFWQMIGRGTRLRPNLFGPGKDKSEFLIFDHYGNFDFFEQEYKEPENVTVRPLLQTTFEARVALAQSALKHNHIKAFDTAIDQIKADLSDLPEASIAVQRELRKIHQLTQTDALQKFDARTQHLLMQTMAPLMAARVLSDKHASQFDRLIAEIAKCFVEQASCLEDGRDHLMIDISMLAVNIQAVRQKSDIIDEVQSAKFWQELSVEDLERVRKELRGIMKYRKPGGNHALGTSRTKTQDGGVERSEREAPIGQYNEALLYRRRLKAILKRMVAQNPTLKKIRDDQPITEAELKMLTSTILTNNPGVSLEVLNEFYGRTADQLHLTLRELVGLDAKAVDEHFAKFLREHPTLTAQQVTFLNLLKNYIAEHGSIVIDTLYDAPFTSVSHEGVDGVFPADDVDELIAAITPFLKTESQSQEVQE
ncbi:DEAD/DEAH box helicase family protein [Pseudidiomarina sp. 1APP75-32.1]|uniref:DEAD/DEAH box helicase family protein n=1 Tax=Pseudidiomarina terrestris TaxID=2820060 RepID=A0AAW7R306_9GAMM|nr:MULTISPECIES: DEAD/DEAH box helicase family protein [unclassified Pseudidiomarina]MDN7125664.1 DEAD/DEAH box helicase family protein [Pseudidiomarina sp. 1APP75-32.1]MDN7130472.1 DEAD/DEAH box helicase family protein [Pseudidiomarina sp. 1APR75-15]